MNRKSFTHSRSKLTGALLSRNDSDRVFSGRELHRTPLAGMRNVRRALRELIREKETVSAESRRKSEFLAHLSHEIRTPLYGVIGTASLLAKTALSAEQALYVETLQEASKTLMGMINEVLDFSKFEMGRLEISNRPFSLHKLSQEILDLFAGMAKGKKLQLKWESDPHLEELHLGDRERLSQVLMNLVSNALKYTSQGHVTLRWTALQDTRSHQVIRGEVIDSGPGIASELQNNLFRPYFRVEGHTSTAQGTGLGLSISKMIVEKFQGRIGVQSEPGQGSIFWFEIPLAKCHKYPEGAPESATPVQSERPMDLSFFKILVAEDNEVNQRILAKMLEKMGVSFKLVRDGTEAVKILEEQRFDMLLMDCYMTPMNGFEATEKIRQSDSRYRNIPILAFTASASKEDRERCLNAGMNDCIVKPVTYEQLMERVQYWTDKIYNELPVLDEEALDKIRAVDDPEQNLLRALWEIYSRDTREEVQTLGELITDGQLDLAKRKAHKLKSSAAQLGAWRFEKFCNLMENEEDLSAGRAQILYSPMRREYESSVREFMEKLSKS